MRDIGRFVRTALLLVGVALHAGACRADRPPDPEAPPAPTSTNPPDPLEGLVSTNRRLNVPDLGTLTPQAIVLHSTSGLPFERALVEMERRGMGVHVLVDTDGTAYRIVDSRRRVRAAAGLDDLALHVSVVGEGEEDLLAREAMMASAARVVNALAERFGIPKSNLDVASRRGVFTHMQAKYRFGGLKRGEMPGRMEPGEGVARVILDRIGGRYFEEKDWTDRGGEGWVFVAEGKSSGAPRPLTKGRGLTSAPRPALRSLEVAEERRMRYVDRGTMEEVRGIVLHFTATETYEQAVRAFEARRLGPSILVDTDGRAWQVVDRLEDRVVAAAGTNEHCVQIEIVGAGEAALLENAAQRTKVVEVVSELCDVYGIPRTNHDIEARRGVFSHGQAKKRWGRSAWMWGTDFDPGERYMRVVLEGMGGTCVEERDWKGRLNGDWVVVFDDWLP